MARAYDFARVAHDGQLRKDGTPYFGHPEAVGRDLWERYGDPELAAAGLLHDVPEDCPEHPVAEMYERFGAAVGYMVDAMTKAPLVFHAEKEARADPVEKLLAGGMRDPRCLLLKIADRDHNLSTVAALARHKQVRMAFETQAVYEPLRELFGMAARRPSVGECREKFLAWLAREKIATAAQAKEALFSTFFGGLGKDGLETVMRRASGVQWRVADRSAFLCLFEGEAWKGKLEIVSMSISGAGAFECLFRMTGPHVAGAGGAPVTLGSEANIIA